MKDKWMVWKKLSICLLTMAVVFSAGTGVGRTEAWFVDAGMWVEASYGVGVIDYTVYLNGENIEKIKEGQKIVLTVPIVGSAKLGDSPKPVAAVSSALSGSAVSVGAHDEFDEGVTLVRTKIVNKGGLPVGIRATVTGSNLTGSGIVAMVVPQGSVLDQTNYGLTPSGAAFQTYRGFILDKLNNGGTSVTVGTYEQIVTAVEAYHKATTNSGKGVTNNTIVYPGKLPSVLPDQVKPDAATALDINVLCWAEYGQMPWSDLPGSTTTEALARNNTDGIDQRSGQLVLTIQCTL